MHSDAVVAANVEHTVLNVRNTHLKARETRLSSGEKLFIQLQFKNHFKYINLKMKTKPCSLKSIKNLHGAPLNNTNLSYSIDKHAKTVQCIQAWLARYT